MMHNILMMRKLSIVVANVSSIVLGLAFIVVAIVSVYKTSLNAVNTAIFFIGIFYELAFIRFPRRIYVTSGVIYFFIALSMLSIAIPARDSLHVLIQNSDVALAVSISAMIFFMTISWVCLGVGSSASSGKH